MILKGILKNPNSPNFQIQKVGDQINNQRDFSYKKFLNRTKQSQLSSILNSFHNDEQKHDEAEYLLQQDQKSKKYCVLQSTYREQQEKQFEIQQLLSKQNRFQITREVIKQRLQKLPNIELLKKHPFSNIDTINKKQHQTNQQQSVKRIKINQNLLLKNRQQLQANTSTIQIPFVEKTIEEQVQVPIDTKIKTQELNDKIFIVKDESNLIDPSFRFKKQYILISLNQYWNRLIPQTKIDNHEISTIRQQVQTHKVPEILGEQIFYDFIMDINKQFKMKQNQTFKYCFTLVGKKIESLSDINENCKILIICQNEQFIGLQGISHFIKSRSPEERQREQENPKFLKQRIGDICDNWVSNNNLIKEIDFNQQSQKFFSKTSKTFLMSGLQFDSLKPQNKPLELKQTQRVDLELAESIYQYLVALTLKDKAKKSQSKNNSQMRNAIIYYTQNKCNKIPQVSSKRQIMLRSPSLKKQFQSNISKTPLRLLDNGQSFLNYSGNSYDSYESFEEDKTVNLVSNKQISKPKYKTLNNNDMKALCAQNGLKRRVIYDLYSQFNAMKLMENQYQNNMANTSLFDQQKQNQENQTQNPNISSLSFFKKKQHHNKNKNQVISLNIFAESCQLLGQTLPSVKERLFQALGIDIGNKNAKISWEQFIELYCVIEIGKLDKEKMINFWCRFLDPTMIGIVPASSYKPILEELIRGRLLNDKNEGTQFFASNLQKQWKKQGCLNENKELIIDKLREAFQNDHLDIEIFCNAFGKLPLKQEKQINEIIQS